MQYTLSINQSKSLQWGLNAQQAMLFAFVYECPSWCKPITTKDGVFYALSKQKIIDELPLLTDKTDTAYRLLKQLQDKGVINLSSTSNITLIRLTDLGKTWNQDEKGENRFTNKGRKNIRSKVGKKSDVGSEKNPILGRKNIREGSEKSPTNHYTSNHYTNNHGDAGAPNTGVETAPESVQPDQQYPDLKPNLFDRATQEDIQGASIPRVSDRNRFAMHWEWSPGSQFAERCRSMGIPLGSFDPDQSEQILGEFRSYWESRPEVQSQPGWEHKLAQRLKHVAVDRQSAAGIGQGDAQNRSQMRSAVTAELMNVQNTDW